MARNKTIPVEYSVFEAECTARGYIATREDKYKLFATRTKNGIKTEIKAAKYTIGYGRSKDDLEVLAEEVKTKGFTILSDSSKLLDLAFIEGTNVMEQFWVLVAMLEDIDGIVAKSRGVATKVFTKEEDEADKFEKIAGRYFYAIQNKDQELLDLARALLSGDSVDHIITRGESVERTEEDSYREHIVPCILIHNEAIRMVLAGHTRAELAQMIAANLAIVRITNAQADLLDNVLKLKTTMPLVDGRPWKFGDCVFARLATAGIKLK